MTAAGITAQPIGEADGQPDWRDPRVYSVEFDVIEENEPRPWTGSTAYLA